MWGRRECGAPGPAFGNVARSGLSVFTRRASRRGTGSGRSRETGHTCRSATSCTVYAPHSGPLERSRAPTASTRHGAAPAPMIVWFVPGGQCTKSHVRSLRSSPSMMSIASPASTRKSSWSDSQWYIAIGSPGPRSVRLIPSCMKSVAPSKPAPSNSHSTPRPFRSHHCVSHAFRTNQPSPFGTRPRSVGTSSASGVTGVSMTHPWRAQATCSTVATGRLRERVFRSPRRLAEWGERSARCASVRGAS
jgi:hypothetical protein